jgi:hypothetical protein
MPHHRHYRNSIAAAVPGSYYLHLAPQESHIVQEVHVRIVVGHFHGKTSSRLLRLAGSPINHEYDVELSSTTSPGCEV